MSRCPRKNAPRSAAQTCLVLGGLLVGFALAPISASAQEVLNIEMDAADGLVTPYGIEDSPPPIIDWRAKGLAYIDLPLRIRARFDASYMHHSYVSDRLASPFVNSVGPGIDSDNSLESRIAFTRPISDGIEIEIAWETRNRIAASNLMGFGRQIVGALIRITP